MPTITWEKTQLEDVKSLVVCVVGTLHVDTLTVEKKLVLTYRNTIAGQCWTNPWPAVPDWTLMPECRCRTEAADYRRKCRCRTNFFPAFRHSVIYLWQKMSPGFPHHLTARSTSIGCLAVNRIDNRNFFNFFFLQYVRYSTLRHLPLLKFHCVGGCWDQTQDCCDFGIDSEISNHLAKSHPHRIEYVQ